MDPDENLKRQLEIVGRLLDGYPATESLIELCELIEALDGWIRNGGFLPARWHNAVHGRAHGGE